MLFATHFEAQIGAHCTWEVKLNGLGVGWLQVMSRGGVHYSGVSNVQKNGKFNWEIQLEHV